MLVSDICFNGNSIWKSKSDSHKYDTFCNKEESTQHPLQRTSEFRSDIGSFYSEYMWIVISRFSYTYVLNGYVRMILAYWHFNNVMPRKSNCLHEFSTFMLEKLSN